MKEEYKKLDRLEKQVRHKRMLQPRRYREYVHLFSSHHLHLLSGLKHLRLVYLKFRWLELRTLVGLAPQHTKLSTAISGQWEVLLHRLHILRV